MEILRSVTQTVLGTQQNGNQPTGAETIEKLLDRVQSSTLLEDRRNGCRTLKSLSRKYRVLVGAHGMDTLIQVLESDRSDHEIVNLALETLVNVTANEIFTEEGEEPEFKEDSQTNIGSQFTEIFTKRSENISLLVSLLDEFDFKVRYPAMKLLINLSSNKPKEIQEEILVIPSAISKLMDMLSDSREIIRNDTLLLLIQLTKGNTSLQKIVAFENAFDNLFDIVKAEGYADGGVVVEDCLILTCHLLKNNPSNQTLFKEGIYIRKISDFFNLQLEGDGWTAQKVANVHYMMKLVCTLVSPHNSAQIVFDCQKMMRSSGLLEKLCSLLMAVGVPADILSDTIIATSEVVRGNKENQEVLSSVMAPSAPPRPAIVVLLMSMVNDKQPFKLRCAVLYCFECYLYRNPLSQAQIVETLLPQTADANQITPGQLLCGGLFSVDPLSNWFSAIALSHALLDNTALKEQLLRVQLATGSGDPPVSLLQQCTSLLQGSKILTRLAILQLLCIWISHCPIAVSHLLSLPTVVPHLTAYLGANEHDEMEVICQGICAFLLGLCCYFNDGSVSNFTKDSLTHLISNRVGVENFTDKLSNILRTEAYSRAAKSPQLTAKQPSEIVFDIEFTKLFKNLEASALNAVCKSEMNSHAELSSEITNYKNVIRDQDVEISRLKDSLINMEKEVAHLKTELATKDTALQKQNEGIFQNGLVNGNSQIEGISIDEASSQSLKTLKKQFEEMTYARDYYYYQMVEKDTLLQNISQQPSGQNSHASSQQETQAQDPTYTLQMETLQKQLQDLQLALYKKDEEMQHYKEASTKNPMQGDASYCSNLSSQLESTRQSLFETISKNELLQKELEKQKSTQPELVKVKNELEKVQSSQEDLLVLLTDQDAKLREYKKRLRQLGQELSDDDEDDDDDIDNQDLL